jgi:hypothetical protein
MSPSQALQLVMVSKREIDQSSSLPRYISYCASFLPSFGLLEFLQVARGCG